MAVSNRNELIEAFHQTLLRTNNPDETPGYLLSGWGSAESQRARFRALLSAANFSGGSILDYGCGVGDLLSFLLTLDFKFDYTGVDMNPKMIELAQRRFPNYEFHTIEMDSVSIPKADYIFLSGVFQFQDRDNPDYYKSLLMGAFERCGTAIAANFLSDLRDHAEKHSDELYLSPDHIVLFAINCSSFWKMDHSYHDGAGDFTLGVNKITRPLNWRRPKNDAEENGE